MSDIDKGKLARDLDYLCMRFAEDVDRLAEGNVVALRMLADLIPGIYGAAVRDLLLDHARDLETEQSRGAKP